MEALRPPWPGLRLRPRGLGPTCRPSVPCPRLQQEKTDTVRCIKSCRPRDVSCMLDLVHTVSHTVVSLPTFREFAHPEGQWSPRGLELAGGVPGEAMVQGRSLWVWGLKCSLSPSPALHISRVSPDCI